MLLQIRVAEFLLFAENVLPYRCHCWSLILGACTISQHPFPYLHFSVRLYSPTRSYTRPTPVSCPLWHDFVVRCIIWEAWNISGEMRYGVLLLIVVSSRCHFGCITGLMWIGGPYARTVKVSLLDFLAHRTCTHSPDAHRADVRRLDIGPHDGPLPRSHCARRLLRRESCPFLSSCE